MTGYQKAQEESTFSYKDCCNDETGLSTCKINVEFWIQKIFKGLSGLNTTKFQPKTCSQQKCYYSEDIIQSIWISSQVTLNFTFTQLKLTGSLSTS